MDNSHKVLLVFVLILGVTLSYSLYVIYDLGTRLEKTDIELFDIHEMYMECTTNLEETADCLCDCADDLIVWEERWAEYEYHAACLKSMCICMVEEDDEECKIAQEEYERTHDAWLASIGLPEEPWP